MIWYPLFLAGDERLEAWSHSESQLIDERRFILRVDLDFDSRLERRLICEREKETWRLGHVLNAGVSEEQMISDHMGCAYSLYHSIKQSQVEP